MGIQAQRAAVQRRDPRPYSTSQPPLPLFHCHALHLDEIYEVEDGKNITVATTSGTTSASPPQADRDAIGHPAPASGPPTPPSPQSPSPSRSPSPLLNEPVSTAGGAPDTRPATAAVFQAPQPASASASASASAEAEAAEPAPALTPTPVRTVAEDSASVSSSDSDPDPPTKASKPTKPATGVGRRHEGAEIESEDAGSAGATKSKSRAIRRRSSEAMLSSLREVEIQTLKEENGRLIETNQWLLCAVFFLVLFVVYLLRR